MRTLFSGFLESEERFAACQAFWRVRWSALLSRAGRQDDWYDTFVTSATTELSNQPLPLDMRNMFEAYSPHMHRAVQVRQLSASDADELATVSFALKEVPPESESDPPDLLLLVFLVLTEETLATVESVFSVLTDPAVSDTQIHEAVRAGNTSV